MAKYLILKPIDVNKRKSHVGEVRDDLTGREAEELHNRGHLTDDAVSRQTIRKLKLQFRRTR